MMRNWGEIHNRHYPITVSRRFERSLEEPSGMGHSINRIYVHKIHLEEKAVRTTGSDYTAGIE